MAATYVSTFSNHLAVNDRGGEASCSGGITEIQRSGSNLCAVQPKLYPRQRLVSSVFWGNTSISTATISKSSSTLRSPCRYNLVTCYADTAAAEVQVEERVHPLHLANARKRSASGVPVYVMLPLDTITESNTVNRRRAMNTSLMALKSAGVEGVMVDVWWGRVEREGPGCYNWAGYKDLFNMIRSHGLKVQAVMSFHQCGGNVGDSCSIPLPKWAAEEIKNNPDIAYTDKHGRRNYEYISLGCDTFPVLKGRTPVQTYTDYMRSFRDYFKEFLNDTIVEIQVGMGPAGELRYPSYPESNGTWRFPGIGEFQCYDKYMLASLRAAAQKIGKSDWGLGGPGDAGEYNNWPEDTDFFRRDGGWNSPYGQFFMEWYSSILLLHGERILSAAQGLFKDEGVKLSGKVSGIHWHYGTRSHASELTAGYYNTRLRDGYARLAEMFGRNGVVLNFTCIEMRDFEQPAEAQCSPEGLIKQVVLAAKKAGVPVAGENALPRYDEDAYTQIVKNSRLSYPGIEAAPEPMCAFTFLRMNQALFQGDNWRRFVNFVRNMGEEKSYRESGHPYGSAETTFHLSRHLVQEAEAALSH